MNSVFSSISSYLWGEETELEVVVSKILGQSCGSAESDGFACLTLPC